MTSLSATAASIREALNGYAAACDDVTEVVWVSQGPPRGWSMAETTEHVATTNTGVHRIVGVLRPLEPGEAIALDDSEIHVGMFDGDGAAPGPGPAGTWTNRGEAVARFQESMQALIELTDAKEAELRAGVFEHPAFGFMDGVQWLLFAAVHTNSHLREITALCTGVPGR
jgi:hypothetical protein